MIQFISVCGASASGKTTISFKLAEKLRSLPSHPSVLLLKMDHYYKDLPDLSFDERAKTNFDHPDSIDIALYEQHIEELAKGNAIEVPEYCFETHRRLDITTIEEPADFVILEGIHTLYKYSLRALSHCTIFIDLPDNIALDRRIQRDTIERGRSIECIQEQFHKTVKPMFDKYIQPKAQFADIILDGQQPVVTSMAKLFNNITFKNIVASLDEES